MSMTIYRSKKLSFKGDMAKSCGKDLLKSVQENWALVLLYLIFAAGMVLGSVFAKNTGSGTLEKLDFLFACNFKARASQSFLSVFFASFASSFLFILACFLCGLSMWGTFFIPLIPLFRGFGLGLTSGYLYSVYGAKGVLFNLLVILPGAFLCCISILMASKEGIMFSRSLASGGQSKIKVYLLHFGAVLGIAFSAALIDFLLSMCFSGLFYF